MLSFGDTSMGQGKGKEDIASVVKFNIFLLAFLIGPKTETSTERGQNSGARAASRTSGTTVPQLLNIDMYVK